MFTEFDFRGIILHKTAGVKPDCDLVGGILKFTELHQYI